MKQKFSWGILSITCIFIVVFTFSFGSINPLVNVFAEKNNSPSKNDEIKVLKNIENKITKKYDISTYKISTNEKKEEIYIEINGSGEYYNSAKKEIIKTLNKITKSTQFEDYSINIHKTKTKHLLSKQQEKENQSVQEIIATTTDYLYNSYPNQIVQINLDFPTLAPKFLFIDVKTLINGKQPEVSKEMEERMFNNLQKKLPFNKFVNNHNIKIRIYNLQGKKMN